MHNPVGPLPLAVLNQSAYTLWSRFCDPQNLDEFEFSVIEAQVLREMAFAGLLLPLEAPKLQHADRNPQLSAWLHITDRCNLRCAYCYLPHVREDMSLETGRAALDATFRSAVTHGYRQVKLKYAGGEPLLRFALIKELHDYARQLAAANNLKLDGVALSNGTLLTDEIVTDLQRLKLRLMISLDGMGAWHDAQRPYAGGRGSFEDVAAAVKLALAHGLAPHLSITISGRNADGLAQVVAWALDHDLSFSINFYRQNSFSVKHADLQLEEEKIIASLKAAFDVIEINLPRHSLLTALTDRANLTVAHERTCSVGQDYLVFDQNGRVAKCHMTMNQPVADLHAADPLALIRDDQIGVQNIPVKEKEGCRDCEWQAWCAGGCPLETFRATGRYDIQSPNCRIYKTIFPEILRLEGLRLLKNAGEPLTSVPAQI